MTNEELLDLMVGISKRTGLSLGEIDYVAQMTVQAEYDPLPPAEWGPRFEFSSRKVSVFDDQYDFNCINANVPKPNALVDFRVAIEEFKRDATNIAAIYADNRKLSITQNWQLFLNQWGWVRFWASRDPDATARKDFEHILKDLDAIAQRIVDKANHLLLRHIAMLNRQ